MKLLGIIENDFVNYKKVSMTLEFPYCSMKCNKEVGRDVCQNSALLEDLIKEYEISSIFETYFKDGVSEAIVCQGLEPLDSFEELYEFITRFRAKSNDDIVIYTGYNKDEVLGYLEELQKFNNIIIKFGRFIPDTEPIFDEVLQVNLASKNQYAEKIS